MAGRAIIAIGGSVGSIEAVRQICGALQANLQVCVLIAVHVAASSPNLLAGIWTAANHSQHALSLTASPGGMGGSM